MKRILTVIATALVSVVVGLAGGYVLRGKLATAVASLPSIILDHFGESPDNDAPPALRPATDEAALKRIKAEVDRLTKENSGLSGALSNLTQKHTDLTGEYAQLSAEMDSILRARGLLVSVTKGWGYVRANLLYPGGKTVVGDPIPCWDASWEINTKTGKPELHAGRSSVVLGLTAGANVWFIPGGISMRPYAAIRLRWRGWTLPVGLSLANDRIVPYTGIGLEREF